MEFQRGIAAPFLLHSPGDTGFRGDTPCIYAWISCSSRVVCTFLTFALLFTACQGNEGGYRAFGHELLCQVLFLRNPWSLRD